MRMRGKFVIAVLVCLLAAGSLMAQTTRGGLEGRVVDEGNQPLPGVTVVISSPALQGTRTDVTDAEGQFRFNLLPPGVYKAVFSLPSFQRVEQENIKIGVAQTITLEVTLRSAFTEEVVVTSEAPVVDVTSTTVGANLSQETIVDLPTGRTFNALTFLATGAVPGGLGGNPSISGASAAENRYVIDDLDTTDPAFGTSGTGMSINFVQEMQVQTGGYEPEYGGALGGVINMITKSGSNEFHGEVFGYYTDDGFAIKGKRPENVGVSTQGYTDWDVGFGIGGRIIRDKLWFFVAYNPNYRKDELERDIFDRDGNLVQTNKMSPERLTNYYTGKLTWQINENNSLTGTIIGDPATLDNQYYTSYYLNPENLTGSIPSALQTNMYYDSYDTGGINYGLAFNSILTEDMILELKVGHHERDVTFDAQYDAPHYADRGGYWTNGIGQYVRFGGPGFVQSKGLRSRDQARVAFTWFLGNAHEIKIGAQWNWNEYEDVARVAGPTDGAVCIPLGAGGDWFFGSNMGDAFFDRFPPCTAGDGGPGVMIAKQGTRYSRLLYPGSSWYDFRDSNYKQNSKGETDESAIFIQDSWKATDYFTLKFGVRVDASKVTGPRSNLAVGPGLAQKIKLSYQDQIQPRIGFTWDFAHNGRSKLFAHYGKFYESIPLDINVRAFGNESYDLYWYLYPENGGLPTLGQAGLPFNPGGLVYHYLLGGGTAADQGLGGQYTEEYVAGVDYEVATNLAVSFKGIYRRLGQVIEDISVDNADTYYITNPGGWYYVNPVTGEELDEPVYFPYPSRIYRGLELAVNKRFSNNWQMYASLLWSMNKGNYGGLFRQDNGQLDPNITSLYDLPDLLEGAYGKLPNDHKWQFKMYGSYRFDFGLVTGYNFYYMTGAPVSKLGSHPLYGGNERFIGNRGEWGRTPSIHQLDLHLEYPIHMGSTDLAFILDVFNVFNTQKATAVDETYTYSDDPELDDDPAYLNPYWNTPTAYQAPRNFRVGVKFSW